jgi:hypothetical protein
MRPEDRLPLDDAMAAGLDMPLDSDLESLAAELDAAGTQARRALHGRTQPTRVFANDLRARLVSGFTVAPVIGGMGTGAALPRGPQRGSRLRPELVSPGETWVPMPLQPRIARRMPTVLPRARWSLLAAAALTSVLVAGALGARLDWFQPTPTLDPSGPPPSFLPTARPTPDASVLPVYPNATPVPSVDPTAKPTPTSGPTSKPTPRPTPKPTPKPDPTKPPVGPMDLALKACPGGVVIDWTKPSPEVSHYHVLRSLDGEVAPTYPAPGSTEIESATSWSAGTTDGFDASIGGGKTATYRAYAFNGSDQLLAYSPSKTVSTLERLSMGPLSVVEHAPGKITVSWSPPSVAAGCFTYGKLVASEEDSDPSYLKGSPYLAAIGDQSQSSVLLEGLSSGTTVWMKYEFVRATGTGKFIVAASDVLQVTIP